MVKAYVLVATVHLALLAAVEHHCPELWMVVWLAARPWLVALTICTVLYFYHFSEDPKEAGAGCFPNVPYNNSAAAKIAATPPLSATENKFLVVGAGFVGLGMAAALKRHELPFDFVEKEDNIGGNWRYGVYETVHIISSRKTTEFKDYPMPADYPDFPSCTQMREYLDAYASHYHLHDRLVCGVVVHTVVPVNGGADGWDVLLTVRPTGTTSKRMASALRSCVSSPTTAGKDEAASRASGVFASLSAGELCNADRTSTTVTIVRRYKGVIICLGHHWCPRSPTLECAQKFKGKLLHSKQVWSPAAEFAGKRVLVIGGGNSACDLATEAGRFGKCSDVSLRRGVWFIPRTFMGRPTVDLIPPWLPMWAQRATVRVICWLSFGSYSKNYPGLQEPSSRPFDVHPTINSDLLQAIKLGRVRARAAVRRVTGPTTVEFVDGSVGEYDVIVTATGFKYALPMLCPEIVEFVDGVPQLYGGLVVPHYRHLYIAVGGQVRYGAGPMISVGGQALGHAIKTQDKLVHPLGSVLRALWQRPLRKSPHCADALMDPVEAWNSSRSAPKQLAYLPLLEKLLMKFKYLPATPDVPLLPGTNHAQSPLRDRLRGPPQPPQQDVLLGHSNERPRWRHVVKGGP